MESRGEKSVLVRQFTELITRAVFPMASLGEILAIRHCFLQLSAGGPGVPMFRYMNDPRHVEWIKDPQRMVEEIQQHVSTTVDCDEVALCAAVMCLQAGREVEFVALGYKPNQLTHVGARVKERESGKWIWVDAVASARARESASSAKEILKWSLE